METFLSVWESSRLLTVYRSVLVEDEDEVMQPVRDVLSSRSHRLLISEESDDESMMFGRALLTVYRLED